MNALGDQIKNLSPEKRALLEKKLAARNAETTPAIPRRQAGDPRVLSCAQHQLWFLDQLAPGASAYNVPHAVHMRGALDAEALQKSLNAIVGRQEVLRTMYLPYQGKVIPAVAKQWSVELNQIDLRDKPNADYARDILPLLRKAAARPFDQARELKLRAYLYRLPNDKWIFLHVSHHIAWDLHSRAIFYRELEQFYRGFRAGEEVSLKELPIQYADYALYQSKRLQGETLEKLNAYWKEKLTGATPALTLPADFPRPALQDLSGVRLPLNLSVDVLDDAKRLARDNKVTLYMTLLTSFYIFLHGYSGQGDITVGSPFDERRHPEIEPLIGMFINTLALRIKVSEGATFLSLLPQTRETILGGIAHQELPFEKIVDAVQPPRDPGRMPLFQANFRLQTGAAPPLHLDSLTIESISIVDNETSKFDLALELPSVPEGWGYLEYSARLFKPETAQRMRDDYQILLRELLAQPDAPIHRLKIMQTINSRR